VGVIIKLKRLAFLFFIAGIITIFVRTFLIEGIYVASGSMEPNLPQGMHLFLEKVSIRFHPLKRGDIVVFPSPVDHRKDLIKRVVALPGETIKVEDKRVFINGRILAEPYVQHTRDKELLEDDDMDPVTVPDGCVFVMGDNRDESEDSRDWKDEATGRPIRFIRIKDIKGRIIKFY